MLYSIFFFFMYGTSFIAMQYLNLYYRQMGFSSVEITKVIVISTIFSIFSSLYLGYKFDNSNKKYNILYFVLIGSLFTFVGIAFFESFIGVLISNIIFSMIYCSMQPLFTTTTLENIKKKCKNFGIVRIFGTIGFCVSSIGIPLIRYEKGIFISMVIYSIIMIIVFTIILKKDKIGSEKKKKQKFKIKEVFQDKITIKLILFVCLINVTMGAYFNFFGIYFTEELRISKNIFGVLCAVSTLAEIPFLLLSGKIFSKYNVKQILLVSGIITAVRWGLCGVFTSQLLLIIINLLHGFGFVVLMTTLNVYITNNCDEKNVGQQQSLFFISTLVFSKVFGSIIGGILPEIMSYKSMFFVNVLICVVSIIFLLVFIKTKDLKSICA